MIQVRCCASAFVLSTLFTNQVYRAPRSSGLAFSRCSMMLSAFYSCYFWPSSPSACPMFCTILCRRRDWLWELCNTAWLSFCSIGLRIFSSMVCTGALSTLLCFAMGLESFSSSSHLLSPARHYIALCALGLGVQVFSLCTTFRPPWLVEGYGAVFSEYFLSFSRLYYLALSSSWSACDHSCSVSLVWLQ